MKTALFVALFAAAFAVSMAGPVQKASACQICHNVLTQVLQDCKQNNKYDDAHIELYITNRCEGDTQDMPQEWERKACVFDLSFAIKVIEAEAHDNVPSVADEVCRTIHIC